MLTDPDTLDRIADVLERLPLSIHERAHIFHAIDTAPSVASWGHAKEIDLSAGQLLAPLTLAEVTGWRTVPSAEQILAGLNRAVGVVAP